MPLYGALFTAFFSLFFLVAVPGGAVIVTILIYAVNIVGISILLWQLFLSLRPLLHQRKERREAEAKADADTREERRLRREKEAAEKAGGARSTCLWSRCPLCCRMAGGPCWCLVVWRPRRWRLRRPPSAAAARRPPPRGRLPRRPPPRPPRGRPRGRPPRPLPWCAAPPATCLAASLACHACALCSAAGDEGGSGPLGRCPTPG